MSANELIAQYIEAIDASRTLENRLLEVHKFYDSTMSRGELQAVFISEFMNQEGQRTYENAWFIYEDLWCEAHNFILEDQFDMSVVLPVSYMVFSRERFEHGQATPASRLKVDLRFGRAEGQLKASGANCEFLFTLATERFLPLMKGVDGTRSS